METVLDLLFVYGPTIDWGDLWDMVPDRLRAYPYGFSAYTDALCRLRQLGWLHKKASRAAIGLTATAWLLLNIGRYPWTT